MVGLLSLVGSLVGAAVMIVAIVSPLLAIIAFRRSRHDGPLDRRLAALERELAELRQRRAREQRAPVRAEEPAIFDVPPAPPPVPVPDVVRPADVPVAAAPEPPPPPREPPTPPAPPSPPWWEGIEWERLFGVRAAAVLGGVALALAGLLFFKYSIEHGLISPTMRVVLGTVIGVGAIAGAEWNLRGRYAGTANALAGGGIVVLYAAFWAAAVRYELVPIGVGFVLMASVTATCAVLAWRHASQLIALLGLAGGFATPLLLSTGSDRPIGLFGYLLLLDAGVLALARARRWPRLATASLVATVLYQGLWIATRMGPGRLFLGLGILAVFAVLFAVAGRDVPEEERKDWLLSQAGAVLVPFGFALYLAGNARFGAHLYPVAMLLALLCAAAGWLSRVQRTPHVGTAAAVASLAVTGAFLLSRHVDGALAWEVAGIAVGLALVFHVFVELEPETPLRDGPSPAAALAAAGLLGLLVAGSRRAIDAPLWPWLAGWSGLTVLLWRHGRLPEREWLHLVAAIGVALGLGWVYAFHADARLPPPPMLLGLGLAAGIVFQAAALAQRPAAARRMAEHAAALLAILLIVHVVARPETNVPAAGPYLLATAALGLLVALAASRLGEATWLVAAFATTAVAHFAWSRFDSWESATVSTGLALQLGTVVLFTAWPFITAARFRKEPLAWYAAALVAPAWFLSLKRLYEIRFGDDAIAVLPIGLALVSLAAVARARQMPAPAIRTGTIAWFAAAALGFVTVAIPLQLEKEWITIGWALEGLAVTVLWTRLDYPGLKWFGLALLAATTVRLVANPAVLGYYPRPEWRIVNWLFYTYLVPAAAMLTTARVLEPHEVGRAHPWERQSIYRGGRALGAAGAGLAGLVVIFVWINLAIADWFATGATLMVSFERLPARDLATSIAWILYALALLALGVGRGSIGLRWVSLGLLMITIAKVFLHDLGELRDLYRVASLLGLAVSLLGVSLAYQRFVFRTVRAEGST